MKRKAVKEGESVTLDTRLIKKANDFILWYFNDALIAEITEDQSKICTDVQCDERFRDRLKLDHPTGSLTITNITNTHSGEYKLLINSQRICRKQSNNSFTITTIRRFSVTIHGFLRSPNTMFVPAGSSVTLHTDLKLNRPVQIIRKDSNFIWYFNDIRIAQINGDLRYICTDVQCNAGTERFRDRLKLDHQTGSLNITGFRLADSGLYKLISNSRITEQIVIVYAHGFYIFPYTVFVKEGDSVTLHADAELNLQEKIIRDDSDFKWHFYDTRIAEIRRYPKYICTDVQCADGNWRFSNRLKLDHQTGSLTITYIRPTDSGFYKVQFKGSGNTDIQKGFNVAVHGFLGVDAEGTTVSVMEGDSVTLNLNVQVVQQHRFAYMFNDIFITEFCEDQRKIFAGVDCNEGTERFRDRLKVDSQTGSLTITNTRTTDSGLYVLQILLTNLVISQEPFSVAVHGVSAAERDKMKRKAVKEGESVTLDTRLIKKANDFILWYFNDALIAEITEDQSKICTDVQCDERFRDRLKLDHPTGSLTITNITNTHSGEYKLLINSQRICRKQSNNSFTITTIRRFSATIHDVCNISCKEVTGDVGKEVTLTCSVSQKRPECCIIMYKFQYPEKYNNSAICKQEFPLDSCEQRNSFTCRYTPTTEMTGQFRFFVQTKFGARKTQFTVNITEPIKPEIVAEETATKESVTVTEETVTKESVTVTEETVTKETATKETVAEETATKESVTVTEETVTKETVAEQTATKETATKEAVAEETVTEALPKEGVGLDGKSPFVTEGDSVIIHTGVETNQQEVITWIFSDTRIAEITGDLSRICTDVQCNEGTERFRGRLKLDHQTGSLNITNITDTDSGLYQLEITSKEGIISKKYFSFSSYGFLGIGSDGKSAFVMEGDSVIIHTGVKTNQQEVIKWIFSETIIAVITGDLSKICTDVECNEGTERFRGRLKLDHQTGSLNITNITDTDSGLYQLEIINSNRNNVPAAEQDKIKRKSMKEGESITLNSNVTNPNNSMVWYFNDTLITEITGEPSKICTDVRCDERFRDRLKLDHQTGSLTITNTRTTESGEYKLKISSRRMSIIRSFSVSVTTVVPTGIYTAVVPVLLLNVAVAVLIYSCWHQIRRKYNRWQGNDQVNVVEDSSPDQKDTLLMTSANQMSQTETEAVSETPQ
ncbi:uncharacterized protein LOC125255407 isoform X2 [Megalobrama amblycephala]|uniref:uncharacterized protein LOC125255407 isoform X2 n=1 Tax=Megalobrama amblycephala TaxID=75352 RepID=UPI002014766F|nr:uncharacterized protein LOC125255407 isoform X2 [Megalobrama amblycephala]